MIQNYYGTVYSCDIGDKEYCRWREFRSADGSVWPCYRMPVGTVMGGQFWAAVPRGRQVVDFTPEDMFRYTVLQAGANTDGGGVQWAAGPYPDAEWETGIREALQKLGAYVDRAPGSVKQTLPSASFVTKEGTTVAALDWGVATTSADGRTEYLHILKPRGRIVLGKIADGRRFADPRVLWPVGKLTAAYAERDGTAELTLTGETDPVDTVVALQVQE